MPIDLAAQFGFLWICVPTMLVPKNANVSTQF